jgi:hypothetical protein
MSRISPTIGRMVYYYPSNLEVRFSKLPFVLHGEGPLSANIAHVFSDTMVSLSVIDSDGNQHARTSVSFIPDDTLPVPDGNAYATWMPFQFEQVAQQGLASKMAQKQPGAQSHNQFKTAPTSGEPAPSLSGDVGGTTQTADSAVGTAAADPTQPAA